MSVGAPNAATNGKKLNNKKSLCNIKRYDNYLKVNETCSLNGLKG